MKKINLKNSKGITLIALVVTVIVLIILAGISISLVLGENGIITKARDARKNTDVSNEKEQIKLQVMGSINENGLINAKSVKDNINNHIAGASATTTISDSGDEFPIIVEFANTGNKYEVTEKGNVDTYSIPNTTWQDNVYYVLDSEKKTITLLKADYSNPTMVNLYVGDVIIKDKAIIDEVEYTTKFPNDCTRLFAGSARMTSFSIENIDTSNVTNTSYMFFQCGNLQSINISNFNTNNVTNMEAMFWQDNSLKSIDVSNWNTDKVKSMREMFGYCKSLSELNLSTFNVEKVTDMGGMFSNVSAKLDLSGWEISAGNILNSASSGSALVFSGNKSEEINARNWDVSSAGALDATFRNLSSLKHLDISGWNFGTGHTSRGLFDGCTSLTTVTGINQWQLSSFNLDVMPFASICKNCTALGNKLTGGIWDNGTWSDDGTFQPTT